MDANFFRFVIEEGTFYLKGARIEKIYSPGERLWTFKLSSKINLVFFYGAKENFLFFSKNRPENPLKPHPRVGWWRKKVQNRWIKEIIVHWPERRFVLKLSERSDEESSYVLFDLKQGLYLLKENPIQLNEVSWPALQEIIENKEIYKKYSNITSPLRYALLNIPSTSKQEEIYSKLIAGDISKFYLYESDGPKKEIQVSLWPRDDLNHLKLKEFDSALDAAEYYGWKILSGLQSVEKENRQKEKRLKKRLKQERQKFEQWIELGEIASLIQENLFRFDAKKHYKSIKVQGRDGSDVEIELDPSKSLLENMQKMFKKAKKGKRGLDFLQHRKKIASSLHEISLSMGENGKIGFSKEKLPLPSRLKDIKVKVFLSSDGFYMVRGRDKKANHKLLSYGARAHDLWFHVEGGAGAHLIVIRDNPKTEIPRTTLEEAAQLAALASYQKEDSHARVIGTEVRYVKKSKGMSLGHVEVLKVQYSLLIKLDPSIEDRLRIF